MCAGIPTFGCLAKGALISHSLILSKVHLPKIHPGRLDRIMVFIRSRAGAVLFEILMILYLPAMKMHSLATWGQSQHLCSLQYLDMDITSPCCIPTHSWPTSAGQTNTIHDFVLHVCFEGLQGFCHAYDLEITVEL